MVAEPTGPDKGDRWPDEQEQQKRKVPNGDG
jgi:hypothetical protein